MLCSYKIVGSIVFFITIYISPISGQTPFPPPNQIQVYTSQGLSFGSFFTGSSGGAVQISPLGVRTTSGTVIGLASNPGHQAIFNVRLIPGRLVSIVYGPNVTLNRIGGGGSMTMSIGPSDKGTSFVTSKGHPFMNPVQIGGTLYVGNMTVNPPGSYQGVFSITFIQE